MDRLRLSAIDIASLGDLRNVKLDGLSPALNVIYGPNESGKSTVRDAIRYALFGFPRTAKGVDGTDERQYLKGARDVALTFAGANSRVVLRRDEPTRKQTEGKESVAPESGIGVIHDLRRDVSPVHYHSMWSVSIENMPAVNVEKTGNVTVLNSLLAALHGTKVNPNVARAALDAQADQVWSRKGSLDLKTLIEQVRELDDLIRAAEREAQDALAANEDSRAAQVRVDELGRAIAVRQQALDEARTRRADTSRALERLSDAVRGLDSARDTMASLDDLVTRATSPSTVALAGARQSAGELAYRRSAIEASRSRIDHLSVERAALEQKLTYYEGVPTIMVGADLSKHTAAIGSLGARIAGERDALASLEPAVSDAGQPDRSVAAAAGNRRRIASAGLVGLIATFLVTVGSATLYAQPLPGAFAAGLVAGALMALVAWAIGPKAPANLPTAVVSSAPTEAAEKRLAAAHASLSEYLKAYPELADLDGREADDVAALVGRAHERAQVAHQLDDVVAEIRTLTETVGAWDRACQELIAEHPLAPGVSAANIEEFEVATGDAARAIESAAQSESRRAAATADIGRLESSVSEARAALAAAAATIGADSSALDQVGLGDSDRSIEHATQVSHAVASALAVRGESLEREIASLDNERQEAATLAGQLTERYNSALGSGDLESHRARREELIGEVEVLAERYAVSKLAAELISRAHVKFGGNRGPEILTQASEVFALMTEGHYIAIHAKGNDLGGALYVERADGSERVPGELSTGTVEQLYLSLRIGALLALPETGADLPILLDDVLVNFDEQSRAQTVQALALLAQTRQIIYFTCHPTTAAELVEAGVVADVATSRLELPARRPSNEE